MNAGRPCLVIGLVLLPAFVSCSRNTDRILGPDPTLESVTPPVVCVDQETRTLSVAGAGLSPLVKDVLSDPQVMLPALSLIRIQDLTGQELSGGPIFSAPAEATRWKSQMAMEFDLSPAAAFAHGLYRLQAKNGSGRDSTAGSYYDTVERAPRTRCGGPRSSTRMRRR